MKITQGNPRFAFFVQIMVLSLHYPELRFGQLARFACSLATDVDRCDLDEVADPSVVRAINNHLSLWFGLNGSKINVAGLTVVRGHLIDLLSEYGNRYPDWPTGRLINRIAGLMNKKLDDIEDCDLLAAARQHFASNELQ